jgi:hypothetical protein
MVWSLFAAVAGAGLADVLVRPAGALSVTAAVAVAGLCALVALCQRAGPRTSIGIRHGALVGLRVQLRVPDRPVQVVLEASGRPRPRAPSASPAA